MREPVKLRTLVAGRRIDEITTDGGLATWRSLARRVSREGVGASSGALRAFAEGFSWCSWRMPPSVSGIRRKRVFSKGEKVGSQRGK